MSAVPFRSAARPGSEEDVRKRECSNKRRSRFSKKRLKETYMFVPLSVLGGLFAVGYCISRLKGKRGRKADVQTLFSVR
jgi:hypothetical protein